MLFDETKSIGDIKKKLIIKIKEGKGHYYHKAKITDILDGRKYTYYITAYVASEDSDDATFRHKYCLSTMKILLKIFLEYLKLHSKYSLENLDEKKFIQLELLRFGYKTVFEKFKSDDLEKYEEAMYTKYVHGTTSIEGSTYTLRETDLTLNDGLTVSGKEKREFFEIENYSLLKEYLNTLTKIKINKEFILTIHSYILRNIDHESAGHFRHDNAVICGSHHEPYPYAVIDQEIDALLEWYNNNFGKLHPVELASIFHHRFEQIHPFSDGNGRVGRELLRIILKENGFPSIYISMKDRESYLKSLDAADNNDYKPIIEFVTNNLLEVHKDLIAKAQQSLKIDTNSRKCKNCIHKEKCYKELEDIMKEIGDFVKKLTHKDFDKL